MSQSCLPIDSLPGCMVSNSLSAQALSCTVIVLCVPSYLKAAAHAHLGLPILSIVSDASFSLGIFPKVIGIAEEPPLFLYIHFLLACSFSSLYQQLSCMYSFTLSFPLTTGLPFLLRPSVSLTYIFFTSSSFFLSIWPNHLKVFLFHPFHYTTLHSSSHATSLRFHCFHSPILPCCLITHFHSMHSLPLCPIPCPNHYPKI